VRGAGLRHEHRLAIFPRRFESQAIVTNGTVYEEILRTAKEIGCDVIVMASHRPELKDYLLGPNAARVVRHANCSVLVVRD
jgi:nucleotide-binding universal stress UspA family protein